jgi:hypothetical protein
MPNPIRKFYTNPAKNKPVSMKNTASKKRTQISRKVNKIKWTNSHIDSTFDK